MKRTRPEIRAGIFVTVSVHLAVIVVLLLTVVTPELRKERNQIEMDFTKQDEIERVKEELQKQEELNRRLNSLLEKAGIKTDPVKNVAVDKGNLKDDRGTDVNRLYRDAARVQREYEKGYNYDVDRPEIVSVPQKGLETDPHEDSDYRGPAVVTYNLDGRKASHLSVPAYKCLNGGQVMVIITVEPSGKVVSAIVYESESSDDTCLREYAVKASLKTWFNQSAKAPAKQVGTIIYKFIAQ